MRRESVLLWYHIIKNSYLACCCLGRIEQRLFVYIEEELHIEWNTISAMLKEWIICMLTDSMIYTKLDLKLDIIVIILQAIQ